MKEFERRIREEKKKVYIYIYMYMSIRFYIWSL